MGTTYAFASLAGSTGKTTTVGKLARWLEKKHKKKPMLVAADVYRPAAVDQLKVLGDKLGLPVFAVVKTVSFDQANMAAGPRADVDV